MADDVLIFERRHVRPLRWGSAGCLVLVAVMVLWFVVDVVRLTRWSPVRLRLTSGETLELPNVPPEQADPVRELVSGRLPS